MRLVLVSSPVTWQAEQLTSGRIAIVTNIERAIIYTSTKQGRSKRAPIKESGSIFVPNYSSYWHL
jgi:hypothetical protein